MESSLSNLTGFLLLIKLLCSLQRSSVEQTQNNLHQTSWHDDDEEEEEVKVGREILCVLFFCRFFAV